MTTIRKSAVDQQRAMVGVLHLASCKPATIGVCPACWNSKEQRTTLTIKLANMGYRVACKDDLPEGKYLKGKAHAPGCRNAVRNSDPWDRFKTALAMSYKQF